MPDELRVLEGWVIAAEPGFRDGIYFKAQTQFF